DTAADGPAPARRVSAIGRGERSSRQADAGAVADGGSRTRNIRDGGAAGGVEQDTIRGEAEATAERRHPVGAASIEGHGLGYGNREDRGAKGARGAGA